jgi:hypothetical protein
MKALLVLAVGVAAWPTAAAAQMPHLNARLKAGKAPTARAIVLPAHVSFLRLGVKGAEGMEQEAAALSDRFHKAVCAELSARGVTVLPVAADQANDDTARYRIADLQSKFDHLRTPLRRRPGRVARGYYTMTDAVAAFQPGQADVLVFIRGEGYVQTKGNKALGAAVLNPFLAFSRFRGEVTFVDAMSGEVLAFLRMGIWKNLASDPDSRLQDLVHRTLRPLPLPAPWQK